MKKNFWNSINLEILWGLCVIFKAEKNIPEISGRVKNE
jgi:hypothetical protein